MSYNAAAVERNFAPMAIPLDSIQSPRDMSPSGQFVSDEPEVELTENERRVLEEELAQQVPRSPEPSFTIEDGAVTPQGRTSVAVTPRTSPSPRPPPSQPRPQPPSSQPRKTVSPLRSSRTTKNEEETDEEPLTEEEERHLTFARIKILKKSWPDIEIPSYDSDISLKQLKKLYKIYLARITAEECSGGYKKWLIALFILVEVICCRLLKVDMSGFTVSQFKAMNTYQELLLELAEKYGSSYKSYFPVELRLAFAVGVNAIIFFAVKRFMGDSSGDMAGMIYSALGAKNEGGAGSGFIGGLMNVLAGAPPQSGAGESLQPPAPRRQRRDPTAAATAATS